MITVESLDHRDASPLNSAEGLQMTDFRFQMIQVLPHRKWIATRDLQSGICNLESLIRSVHNRGGQARAALDDRPGGSR